MTLADESNAEGHDKGSAIGDVLCLLSAFFYGCYTVALRWCGRLPAPPTSPISLLLS